jgi:hypothetical protein
MENIITTVKENEVITAESKEFYEDLRMEQQEQM